MSDKIVPPLRRVTEIFHGTSMLECGHITNTTSAIRTGPHGASAMCHMPAS